MGDGFRELSRIVRTDAFGVRLGRVTVAAPDGSVRTRSFLHSPEVVAIVAVHEADLLLVNQFRAAVGVHVLALPMGKVAPGQQLEDAAAAELAEETGFTPGRIERVSTLLACPGWMDQLMHVFRADGLTELAARPPSDDPDDIEEQEMAVVRLPLSRVREAVESGRLRDARSIAAIHLALDFGRLGKG
ncbi:MAG TPA: NUDIX hydrolase [Candidatus Limnocylindrales bacterium]|nr:NUDIX hydrolase [Candidatus Limnocylindrales bacterium]